MTHYVTLAYGDYRMRPELLSDGPRIIELWNRPYVVGNLFMSETSLETFNGFYERYERDPARMNWVVEDEKGGFCGTMGIGDITDCSCTIGRFAMEKESTVPIALPQTLIKSFVFDVLKLKRMNFTVNTANSRIRKFHTILGAVNSGRVERKPASNGSVVVLEHWYYESKNWDMKTDLALCGL